MILSITSLTLKLAALARGGKSLKLSIYRATTARAGTNRNIRCMNHRERQRGYRPPRRRGPVIGLL